MNLRIYEKTRYQNIYRHIKNKNYIVQMSKPVKSTISSIDGEKILKLEDALKIRDNPKIKAQKGAEIRFRGSFDDAWDKYISYCQNELKLSYTTLKKKRIFYNKFFKGKLPAISKIKRDYIAKFINELDCTDKQKNEIITRLKSFFHWCVHEEYIIVSPLDGIKMYKTTKDEMKYWKPEELNQFLTYINNYIDTHEENETAYRTKMIVLLGFVLGDRIGETRALTFGSIHDNTITINHSINYDVHSKDFLSATKTYSSNRTIEISDKVANEIDKYKYYLINNCGYDINDKTIIFFNHKINKPFSDIMLRKDFYRFCEKAGVPKIRLYDLRHTYTVIALNYDNIDMWAVSSRLGHKNIKTTINVYNHITEKVRKEMANSTDKYI